MNMEKQSEDFVTLCSPIYSHMRTVQLYGDEKYSKYTKVVITDIGKRGLKFSSFLRLPINENIVWSFQIEDSETPFSIEAIIEDFNSIDSRYEYKVKWKVGDANKQNIIKLFITTPELTMMFNKLKLSYYSYHEQMSFHRQLDLLC